MRSNRKGGECMSMKPAKLPELLDIGRCAGENDNSIPSLSWIRWNLAILVLAVFVSGCVTTFHEDHYFQSASSRSGHATNYFRLQVDGWAAFSSARYISGYYDERAVDLFFNEIKTGTGT